jgi:hypothetical protein
MGKNGPGVVDQNVDFRLRARNLSCHAADVGKAREFGIMDGMGNAGRSSIQLGEHCIPEGPVARDQDQPRAQSGQALSRDFANSGGGSGHHNGFAVNGGLAAFLI